MRRRWYAALALAVVAFWALHPMEKLQGAVGYAVYRHMGYQTDSMTYRYLPDRFYESSDGGPTLRSDMLRAATRGTPTALKHYFLEPLPNRTVGGSALFMIPQMVLWYFLLPFALIGFAAGIRWTPWGCAFLAAVLFAWAPMGALSIGNVGILVRMRDMATPIVLIFSAAGFWALARGKRGFCGEALDRVAG